MDPTIGYRLARARMNELHAEAASNRLGRREATGRRGARGVSISMLRAAAVVAGLPVQIVRLAGAARVERPETDPPCR
jgi:hypothetical protein